MPEFKRHFVFKHPLFRSSETKTGVFWQNSIYYLWWEFLRRHEGYRQTCLNKGVGRYASLYSDFGDVHSVSFKQWWQKNDRGAKLFAEPAVPMTVENLRPTDLAKLPPDWDQQGLLIVSIPLSFPKRDIDKRLKAILRKNHSRKRGERLMKSSKALYPIGRQFNLHSLKSILDVYDLRTNRQDLTLWEIAQELRVTSTLSEKELNSPRGDPSAVAKKAIMSVTVSRKLKWAKQIIDGVGRGVFPAV